LTFVLLVLVIVGVNFGGEASVTYLQVSPPACGLKPEFNCVFCLAEKLKFYERWSKIRF
jgi:hypothetical protein